MYRAFVHFIITWWSSIFYRSTILYGIIYTLSHSVHYYSSLACDHSIPSHIFVVNVDVESTSSSEVCDWLLPEPISCCIDDVQSGRSSSSKILSNGLSRRDWPRYGPSRNIPFAFLCVASFYWATSFWQAHGFDGRRATYVHHPIQSPIILPPPSILFLCSVHLLAGVVLLIILSCLFPVVVFIFRHTAGICSLVVLLLLLLLLLLDNLWYVLLASLPVMSWWCHLVQDHVVCFVVFNSLLS